MNIKHGPRRRNVLVLVAALSLAGAAGLLHAQQGTPDEHEHGHEHEQAQLWTCPMHPQVVQDAPGTCPICGMDLVPKKAAPEAEQGSATRAGSSVVIDPVVVQNMGVRTALVRRGNLSRTIRTVGSVVAAEDRLSVVNLRFSGWIEKIFVDETGVQVKKGQHLFEVYSPELVTAQQEYLLALRTSGPSSGLAKSARQRLHYLGLPDWQIEQIKDGHTARPTLVVVAPRSGYVVLKNVVAGARVAAGEDLYRIADLSRVWIDTEVYEFDAPWVHLGSTARVELTYHSGQRYDGRVTFIHPLLDASTRTLRVRIELDNDRLTLKPGMFATVEVEAERKTERLVIPTEAVIYSGVRKLVFVAQKLGRYEAREVETGLVGDNGLTEVLGALGEGERVVTSGQFLLDSESQLREAVEKMLSAKLQSERAKRPQAQEPPPAAAPAAADAGAAAAAEPAAAPAAARPKPAAAARPKPAAAAKPKPAEAEEEPQQADTYWTCPMHPQVVQDGPGRCPICGMTLVEKKR